MHGFLRAIVEGAAAHSVQVAGQRADGLGDRPTIVVENDNEAFLLQRPGMVQCFERDATADCCITNDGDRVTIPTQQAVSHGDTQRC